MGYFVALIVLAALGYFIYRRLKAPKAAGGGSASSDRVPPRHSDL